ncbi:Phosphatidylglycerophosphate synthase [Actinopolymorpha cephalotaxi]|uniref:Phosphatidylglycerophosphate synthase n=1 Tax=Actinopolymorpha cephalotaxi TaxID=504797 RepID=A0A1I3A5S3_9ACTN|nr:CDP-alcohol phosphatidyltransferase family protein [Actinopolymorpha cephalotaxi]NYH85330.1 phosphatidylglycerophosphate synthase [Actinopolymorpha cephalotaxi]SFH45358.1 Phosphatidylglycerophosphate synthase [Actinopolymorpha cephalotaxi]
MGDIGVTRRFAGPRAGRPVTPTRAFRRDLAVAAVAEVAVLVLLWLHPGLGLVGRLAGLGFIIGAAGFLVAGFRSTPSRTWTPADRVTLTRLVLIGAVTALVADRLGGSLTDRLWVPAPAVMIVIASVALVLDSVDGRVARRTGTVTDFGARFDMESDAFLILVLSVFVARSLGAWVLAIGAMRYAYVAAGWVLPWLRSPIPPKYVRKVIAAIQGVALVVVSAHLLPGPVEVGVVAGALALLVWSFGESVWWQWQHGRS